MATIAAVERPRVSVPFGSVAIALAIYCLLTIPLSGWLIDDAAISMAYAANWTAGHGLVAQPGLDPVEGYSNPIWVCLFAGLNLLGLMTPGPIKFVSALLVGLSLLSLNTTCRDCRPFARASVLIMVAACSSIVTWTTSGLENPLTLLIACELLRIVSISEPDRRTAIYAACLVAALAMTRPEGLLFFVVPLLTLSKRELLHPYLAVIAVIFGAFLALRYATFGDIVPNTFYAKEAHLLTFKGMAENTVALLNGPFGTGLVMIALFAYAYPQAKADSARLMPSLTMMAVAGALFILMPPDWMPDRRFGTAFFPAVFVFAGIILQKRVGLLAGLVLISLGFSAYRLTAMYRDPTTPMAWVQTVSDRFNGLAREKRLDGASLLMPDIGAALLTSEIRIYDLAGLTDRVIGRTLHNDKARFHDYVFEQLKPTFIKVHGPWAEIAQFDRDPRFRRDYVPLTETTDAWLLEHRGIAMKGGEYMRLDK